MVRPLSLQGPAFREAALFSIEETKLSIVLWARCVGLVSLIATAPAAAADNPLAGHVRAANELFKDVNVARAEGYAPIPRASGIDGGAIGVDLK